MKPRAPAPLDGTRPPARRRADAAPPAVPARPEPAASERPTMDARWHASHPMPRGATIPQRIQWHLDHERACGCRPMPLKLRAMMARGTRPSREPWRPSKKSVTDE